MHYQQLIVAYLAATAAALPSGPLKDRQASGIGSLGGLSGGTGTDSIPTALPTGLFGGLSGGTGTDSIPTALPTGLFGGLGGLGSLGSGSSSGLGGLGSLGSGSSSGLGGLGSLGSGSSSGLGSLGSLSGRSDLSGLTTRDGLDTLSGYDLADSMTENGLQDACQEVTLIFARGTTELGNMGSVVGPGLSTKVKAALNNKVAVQGVTYAADMAGITEESGGIVGGTGGAGTKAMVADVQSALTKCPKTQIVLSGYSQGAMLVHNTMNTLSTAQAASVKVAITFGDPFVGTEPKNIPTGSFKSYCATGDPVCSAGVGTSPSSGGTLSTSASGHLGYGTDVTAAAAFIKGKVTV